MIEKIAAYIGIILAIVAIIFSFKEDNRLRNSMVKIEHSMVKIDNSMVKIDNSMDKQSKFLDRINRRLDLTEVTTALWNDDRAETYLKMLSINHAYGGETRYVELLPDGKYLLTEKGNNLLADADRDLKNRLRRSREEHPEWSSAQIIRDDHLRDLPLLLKSYNKKSNLVYVDLLILVGVINAFIEG